MGVPACPLFLEEAYSPLPPAPEGEGAGDGGQAWVPNVVKPPSGEVRQVRNRSRNRDNTDFVRQLRKSMSVSEQVLWRELRNRQLGFRFRRQVPVGPYVLDFFCSEAWLCVEVDGEQHAARQSADARRDRYLWELGIATYRVPSLDLFEGGPYVRHLIQLKVILQERADRKPPSPYPLPPPQQGEGDE